MRKVKNSVQHNPGAGTYGNCHSACFATILGLEIEDVPHFFADGDNGNPDEQYASIRSFLGGLGLVQGHAIYDGGITLEALLDVTAQMMPGVPLIFGGLSAAGCGHSIVVLNGEIFNDPTDSGLVGPMPDGYWWVTFFSPLPAVTA
jgi:hypothetical protein